MTKAQMAHPAAGKKFGDIQAILFDLDGTLINTDDKVVERLADRLTPLLGRRARPLARRLLMASETPGNGLVTFLDWLGLDERVMRFTDSLRSRRGIHPAQDFRLIEGVEPAVLSLADRYRLAIVTTRSRYHIDRFLEQFPGLTGAFQVTCGLQDTRRLKPHPMPIQLAAERLEVPVTKCLMVGDTSVDIKAGRRAGALTAAVLCGFGELDELVRAGADAVLNSTADLPGIL